MFCIGSQGRNSFDINLEKIVKQQRLLRRLLHAFYRMLLINSPNYAASEMNQVARRKEHGKVLLPLITLRFLKCQLRLDSFLKTIDLSS